MSDGDGLTDYIILTQQHIHTTAICSREMMIQTYERITFIHSSVIHVAPTGDYLAVGSTASTGASGYESVSCTFTLPAGETLDIVIQTAGYGSEGRVYVTDTAGTTTSYGPFSSYTNTELVSFTTAGTYTVEYADTYGDGCNPSSYYGVMCYVQASYTYVSGTVAPTVTTYGTSLDYDDDNDGYSDLDETTNCDDGGAYASTSLPLMLQALLQIWMLT